MSLLLFHQGNVPFILNEDMVIRDLTIISKSDGSFDFQTSEAETMSLAEAIINGTVDAVRVIFDNQALQPSEERDKYGYFFPPIYINTRDSQTVILGMVMFAIPNKDGSQIIQQINIDGIEGMRSITTCYPIDGFFWNVD